MYLKNARFSYERRVKLILICILPFLAAVMLCAVPVSADDYDEPSGSTNLLRTSRSSDNYSVFETAKKTISIRGKYTGDRVRKIFIDKDSDDTAGSYSMKAHEDGTFESELTVTPFDEGEHKLTLLFNSGAAMRYFIFYDEERGWYFPTNGYSETNPRVFEHIYEAPAEAAAVYLSPTMDAEEIAAALEQIKMLAERETEGLDDDYEKARAISRFISEKVYYDNDARDTGVTASTIALCNVLKTAKTVCAGFTNLFCAMAESIGIDAVNIKGGVVNEGMHYAELEEGKQNHEWSAFWYEKEERWVWVDSCWDGSGTYGSGKRTDSRPKYMYFDITDEALALNHRADKAERRHYFAAKPETELLGEVTVIGEERLSEITSQPIDKDVGDDTTSGAEDAAFPAADPKTTEIPASDQSDTVYIIIIAALAAAVIAVGAILAVIIVKGRKM